MTPQTIQERIEGSLPGSRVQVTDLTGGGDHYRVIVVAEQFAGQNPVDRHRMVYGIFQDVLGGELHALSLETRTPAEWDTETGSTPTGSGTLPRL